MPIIPKKQVRYGRARLNPHGSKWDCFMVLNGTRHRARRDSLIEAQQWADQLQAAIGGQSRVMSMAEMADAQAARSILPVGYTLTDAARALARTVDTGPDVPLDEAADRFYRAKARTISPKTLHGYRSVLGRLEALAAGGVREVRPDHIEALLGPYKPVSRATMARALDVFFRWAVKSGMVRISPMDGVDRVRVPEPPKHVLSPEQAARLIHGAQVDAPGLVPYLALSLFAGIRPKELTRLDPKAISQEFIMIGGSVAKGIRARSIRIPRNLRLWLDAYPPSDPITPHTERHRYAVLRRVASEAGVSREHDCLRHSWATYHYEATKDAQLVAFEGGHGVSVIMRHYRSLANPGTGAKYFAITPLAGLGVQS
jgi:integrase/recombinase XerD